MANYDLGTAHGKVQIDYDTGPLKKTKEDLEDVKRRGLSTGSAFDKVGTGIGRAGLVVAAGIGLAVKSAASFEKSVSAIGAVTSATSDQLQQVRDKALQLGRDTKFSAAEAADAMGELAKAGIPLPAIMNGAADATVALAAAGEIALPEAASIASNAMNQFALSAQNMPEIADLIAGAANASAIDVHDLGESMSQVGAVAHSMGITFGETAAAIAVLGNAGIKGSDAGTSLKQMFISLANPTKKSAELMREIGFNAFDSTGHIKDLSQIAGGLKTAMQDMTPQARNAALSIIFGSDAARAGAVFFQQGAEGVLKMEKAMNKISAADVAKKRMDNLSGSVEQLKGSIETAAIKFGELGQGPMKSLIDSLTGLINKFTSLSSNTQQTILVMVASLGGLALFGAGLIKTVKFVQELIAVLRVLKVLQGIGAVFSVLSAGVQLLNGSLAALAANPIALAIALIVIAIAALVVGIILLWKKSETFRGIVIGVWNAIKATISAVADVIMVILRGLVAGFDGMMVGVRALGKAWNAVWKVFAPVVRVAMAVIKGVVLVAFAIIKGIILGVLVALKTAWRVWLFFAPIVQAVMNLITAIVKLAMAIIKLAITIVLVILYQAWRAFWAALSSTVLIGLEIVKAIIRAALGVITGIWHAAVAVWRAIVNAVVRAIHAIMNTWIAQKIVGVVRSGVGFIKKAIDGLASLAKTVGGFFARVYNAVAGPVGKVLKLVGGIGGTILNYFKNAGKWLLNAGRDIIAGLINGIASMINKLRGYLSNITNWIGQWKGPPKKDKVLLVDNAHDIMDGLIRGLAEKVPELEAMLSKIGPGNIAQSVSRSETINAAVGATAGAAVGRQSAAKAVPASGRATATLDHVALVRALKDAGVGEAVTILDGEVVSRKLERTTGRRTNQRRRTQP